MLMVFGALRFEVWPFNPVGTGSESGGDYVEKPVMGRRPPLEFVGEAAENFTISVKLFPAKLGGLNSLEQLQTIRRSGIPQYLMRGDGTPLGWFVVSNVGATSGYLNAQGVGQTIDVEISLQRADAPQDADFFATVIGMLG
ncbi:phage tail protein [Brucella pseudogrignonensis]|uniref:Phage protein U n=1 Tax=Brucella pseudogrignonensis TaxID=419475 RepID=A0ABU1M5K8_9HYPH|nr:phage tail protein [Brucella pseudogrignonensis]MDR6431314.1 phage protein U [Brucella pseudogrignonensis]